MDTQSMHSDEKDIPKDGADSTNNDIQKAAEEEVFPKRSKGKIALIMLSLCLATLLAALDVSIVTTAVPSIAEAFHSNSLYTWVGSAYLLATAAATPVWGKVSDVFGRKPALIAANVIFFVGSLVAGLAYSAGMLIAARAVQGLGGGGLLVLCNVVIGDLFSQAERGSYYGLLGATWAVALGLGPVVGGAFSQNVTWRWCFYFNLPIDGLALAVLVVFLDVKTPKTPILEGLLALDWIGFLLIMGGTLMFLFGLTYGGQMFPWDSAATICLIVFGVVAVILFGLVQWKVARYPTIPLRLFRDKSALAAFGVCFFHGLSLITAMYYLPLYFQGAIGATPILSGVYFLALACSIAFAATFGGMYIGATGNPRMPMYVGLPLMTLGMGLMISLDDHRNWAKIIIYQIITGLGIGPIFQAPLIALQSFCQPEDVGTATSSFEFTRNLATAVSVVIGGVIFDNQLKKSATLINASLPADIANELLTGAGGAATLAINRLPDGPKAVAHKIFADALRPIWYWAVATAAVCLIMSFAIRKQVLNVEHKETDTGLEAEEVKRLKNIQLEKDRRAARLAAVANGKTETSAV